MNRLKIISIIPARSNSKRIKNKNLVLFKQKPLIAHSILHSLASKLISRTIVSTDSKKYLKISKHYGAEVPFLRPKTISKDNSTDLECFNHCLKYLNKKENYFPDIIVHLRPTYPIREKNLIDNCIKSLVKNKKAHLLKTISKSDSPIEKMWFMKKNKQIFNPATHKNFDYSLPDQSLKQSYNQNGCIDIIRVKYLNSKVSSKKIILGYLMDHNFDINTLSDIQKLRKTFKV
tara:strand:- start:151 stop:846 length:696 start_codon:yes stop_codon:yes gene_type:complete